MFAKNESLGIKTQPELQGCNKPCNLQSWVTLEDIHTVCIFSVVKYVECTFSVPL